MPVGQLRQSFQRSIDSDKFFDMVVPGRNILIPDRPVDGPAVLCVGIKVKIAPAVTLSSPQYRPPSQLVRPPPFEWLYFGIRTVNIVGPIIHDGLVLSPGSCDDRMLL